MILIDASVWIEHIRSEDAALKRLLHAEDALAHPYVIGELTLGLLRDRDEFLRQLLELPMAPVARSDEVLELIERGGLSGSGIGYVDAHLLASAKLMPDTRLWTRDKRLALAARHLGVGETLH